MEYIIKGLKVDNVESLLKYNDKDYKDSLKAAKKHFKEFKTVGVWKKLELFDERNKLLMSWDMFDRFWITENSLEIISRYEDGVLTLRGLHYQLVTIGMFNTIRHYKRVVSAMIEARWNNEVNFEVFSDRDREMVGFTSFRETTVESKSVTAKRQISLWMKSYSKNRWENQIYYPEVFIEKKALQGVFETPCEEWDVALVACKGYPSLTFLNDTAKRFIEAVENGKKPVILYFGDYDPSGEDIPRAIKENIVKLGCPEIEVKRIALMEHQVVEWNLPPAPIKEGDSRSASWTGLGQVELDAVSPEELQRLCVEAIQGLFDEELHDSLLDVESDERNEFQVILKDYVKNLDVE